MTETEPRIDPRSLNLFAVRTKRVFTDEYNEKWGVHKDDESTILTWGSTAKEVEAHWIETFTPGQYPHFDKMYRDHVVSVEKIPRNKVNDMRRFAAERHPVCCRLAVLRSCVCAWSTTCPEHGTQCHGTHD